MERERKLDVLSRNSGTENHQNHQFGASSEVKVENEEMSLSLSQWLQPSKFPLSYLALLNEESTTDEKPHLDYVVKKIVLPSRGDAETGPGGGIRTLYSASESDGTCFENLASSKVKPSIRVQSRTNYELFGSSSKVPVARRSSRKSEHPSSKNYSERSSSKVPGFGQSSSESEQHPSSQNYSEKLRSWKERSNRNNNHDFSQLYDKYRDVPSKQSKKYKKSYTVECERKQRIVENIKALVELLPHEVEDTPESILDDVIAHVKLLQLQMKELSRSRLGGEAISHPLISIEGYGNFINEEHTMRKPLEEIMADLLTNDPDAAASLFETKGLYLLPFSSVNGFR